MMLFKQGPNALKLIEELTQRVEKLEQANEQKSTKSRTTKRNRLGSGLSGDRHNGSEKKVT